LLTTPTAVARQAKLVSPDPRASHSSGDLCVVGEIDLLAGHMTDNTRTHCEYNVCRDGSLLPRWISSHLRESRS
jgi:hypothetical protein